MHKNVNREKELFYCFFASICCFIDGVLDDFEVSRDIASSIFQEYWKEILKIEESGDAKELVEFLREKSLIAVSKHLDEKDQIQKAESDFAETHQTGFQSADAILIEKELLQLMHTALSKRQEEALKLFFSGYTTEEGATMMGIKESTFRNTKNNALKKLRKEFTKPGILILILLLLISL